MIELIQTYLIISLVIYFIPFLLSLLTGNRTGAVFVMNLFLGWTFIGWIWALVWAVTSDNKPTTVYVNTNTSNDVAEKESEPIVDRSSLLTQLSQLHELKEKSVLTEEIYERERLDILSKFQNKSDEIKIKNIPTPIIEEETYLQENTSEYESPFGRKPWIRRNKNWVTLSGILVIVTTGFFFLNSHESTVDVKKTILGKWEVYNLTELYGRSVNDVSYEFNNDSIYMIVSTNTHLTEHGRVLGGTDTTFGKYKISGDGKLITLYHATEVSHSSNNKNITDTIDMIEKYDITQISHNSMTLFGPQEPYNPDSVIFHRKE